MMLQLFMLITLTWGQFGVVPIIYSNYTSPSLIQYFITIANCLSTEDYCSLKSTFQAALFEVNSFSDFEKIFGSSEWIFVFDATNSLSMSSMISQYSLKYGFIQFTMSYSPDKPLPYALYSDYSLNTYKNAALAIARAYNIHKAIAIITSDFNGMDFQNDFGVEIVAQFIIISSAPYEYIFWLISKEIKPMGVKWFFFMTNSAISKLIQKALVEADMDKDGYTYLYIQEAAWSAYLKGSILLEGKWFHSTGLFNYYNNIVYWGAIIGYQIILNNSVQGSYSPFTLNKIAMQTLSSDQLGFTIWNIPNTGNVTAIGVINGNGLKISIPPMFSGGTYSLPNNENIKIPFSINGESNSNDNHNAINQLGAISAISKIKKEKKLLPNFDIIANNITNCNYSDYNSSFSCIKNSSNLLGNFHISSIDSSITLSTIQIFESLNISTPILGVETSTILANKEYSPQYSRISYPNSYTASATALLLSIFGISKCSLLYTSSIWGEDFNSQFESQINLYDIKILNENKAVPQGYNGNNKNIVKDIIDVKTRYVVLEVQQPDIFYIIEAFYDLGMRNGDIYLIVGDGMISISDLDEKEIGSESYKKRKEIMSGLIYISFLAFESQVGLDVKSMFLSQYGFVHDYMCLFYDAAYLGIYTMDSLLSRGENVNSSTISEVIRDVKFLGCSGTVRISQDGTDRFTINLAVYNLIEINDTWTINLCGIYDPSELIVLKMKEPISWETNGGIPNDIIGDGQECPFRNIQIQSFIDGYFILIAIEIIPIIIGVIFVVKFRHSIFNSQYPKLISVQKENFLDSISYLLIIIESLQYMQIGPDFTNFFPQWNDVTKLASSVITGWNKNNTLTFWNQVELFQAISLLWFVLIFLKKLKIKSENFIILAINEFSLYFLPIVGDTLFLPISLYLFQTFQCTSSIGDNFKDSFHNQHCSTFCWQGEHINYIIISSTALWIYIPFALYFRSSWKSDLPFHFQEHPFNITLKSFMQITLIILKTIVFPASETIFLWLCIGLLLIYIIISAIKMPFNYDRASMWYIICLASALLLWISCALADINKIAALILLFVGWSIFGVVGVIYQTIYLPSLLEVEKGQDIRNLFRFQLSAFGPEIAGIAKSVKYIYAKNQNPTNEETNKVNIDYSGVISSEDEGLKSSCQLYEVSV